jgi:hypothetical protein
MTKYDGTPYESSGAKPAPEPNHYERETEGDEPWGHDEETQDMANHGDDDTMGFEHEHEDDDLLEHEGMDLHQHEGHPVMASAHSVRHDLPAHKEDDDAEEEGDDGDDMLLDEYDSEVGPGEHLAQEHATPHENDPSVTEAAEHAKGLSDPTPTDPAKELESFSLGSMHGAKGRPSAEGDR